VEDGAWRHDLLAPSAAWDNDWERSTVCWDPWTNIELKGTVYTFGSMDGLWQGRLLVRLAFLSLFLSHPTLRPRFQTKEDTLHLWITPTTLNTSARCPHTYLPGPSSCG
jgi:hypothetical protein